MLYNISTLKKIAEVGYNCWKTEELKWINSNLKELNISPLKDLNEFTNKINDEDFLFKMIIIWYFEKGGYNSSIKPSDVKTHAIAVLEALERLKTQHNIYHTGSLINKVGDFSKEWFELFKQIHESKYGNYNPRFNRTYLTSLIEFCERGNLPEVREEIKKIRLCAAYIRFRQIKGVGEKIAKMIVRYLAFLLTPLGEKIEIDCKGMI